MITPRLAQRFLNVPLLLEGRRAASMLESLRIGAAMEETFIIQPRTEAQYRPYDLVDGIAVIEIRGILVHGACWGWEEVSYEWISQCFDAAMADGEVRGIVLHIDSPGGEVAGCFDLADKFYALRKVKPIIAILDECAFSAAYALASAASRIYVPRTGGTGSIGVIALRLDITRALEQSGLKITTLAFGDRKTDTYPTTPLSKEAEERLQADIDALGMMFLEIVARNRGISAEIIREMQSGTFLGAASVENGLADAVMTPEAAFLAVVGSEIGNLPVN